MNYQEFKRLVYTAGLQMNQFATLIDMRATSIAKYTDEDEVPARYAVLAVLLADVVHRKLLNVPDLLRKNGFVWPPEEDQKVTNLEDYRGKGKQDAS